MKVTRSFADASGETRLEEIELENALPVTLLRCNGVPRKMPFHDFHPAPARGYVTTFVGRFEISTTNGDRKRFEPGEWFLADDVGTKGHTFEGIDDEIVTMHIGIPDDWTAPGAS